MGYIYGVQTDISKRIKIGFSNDPQKRIQSLQTSCPEKLELIFLAEGTIEDERRWHKMFEEDRVQGEWFTASEGLLYHIGMSQINYRMYQCLQAEDIEGAKKCFHEAMELSCGKEEWRSKFSEDTKKWELKNAR